MDGRTMPTLTAPARRVCLAGAALAAITERQCVAHVVESLRSGRGGWIITPNVDILRQRRVDASVRALLEQADLLVADGMPLIWASRLAGRPLPERVAGSNLISSLSAAAAAEGRSVFLLGGAAGAAAAAARVLKARHPDLHIAGIYSPPVGFEKDAAEMSRIMRMLMDAQPAVVFVAMGFPKSERLVAQVRSLVPGAWWIGVGISFSFLCGQVVRAPKWMQRCGLEWVHRLVQEPRRLAKRYLVHDLPFAVGLLAWALRERLSGRMSSEMPEG